MKVIISVVALISVALAAPDNIPNLTEPEILRIAEPEGRIINGAPASSGQFPWQCSVQGCLLAGLFCSHICGATIISPTALATAAHCYSASYSYRVICGVTSLTESSTSRQQITVTEFIRHPLYPGGSTVAPHDVGILKLGQSLVYSDHVQPAQLPAQGEAPSGQVQLSGWGATVPTGGSTPDILQHVTLEILTMNECLGRFTELMPGTTVPLDMEGGNVCTSGDTGLSACSGDSGGPLAQNRKLLGIVSWGLTPCGTLRAPSVFAAVNHYVDWIHEHVHDTRVYNTEVEYKLSVY